MAGTPPEDLMEWLLREEERLGIDVVQRGSLDMESARELLSKELGREIKPPQADAFVEAGIRKYEALPTIGVSFAREWHPTRTYAQNVYRDIATGRYVSKEDVSAALWATL